MGANNVAHKHKIISDRVEIYRDFTMNLLSFIYDYYLDKETLALDEDIRNHFMFCYRKVCGEFLEEEIDFTDNEELIEYFYVYYYHHFYKSENDVKQAFFSKFWSSLLEVDKPKNRNTLKLLSELYSIFDKSITFPKNILELV